MQVEARRDIRRSGLADSQAADQSGRNSNGHGGGWIGRCFKQQVAHTLVAQDNTGIHGIQVDGQGCHIGAADISADRREVMHFQIVGVFGGGEVEVRVSGIQCPGWRRY